MCGWDEMEKQGEVDGVYKDRACGVGPRRSGVDVQLMGYIIYKSLCII